MKNDFYKILGVSNDCDEQTLKSAFRKLAMKYHPDRNPGNKEAEKRFKEIGEAYDILKDPQKRAAYDRYGHSAFDATGNGSSNSNGFSGGFSDIFEDIFGDMMGGQQKRNNSKEAGSDISYNMKITLQESYSGKTEKIKIRTAVICKSCMGSGAKKGTKPVTCSTCHGIGRIRSSQGFFSIERSCPSCNSTGKRIEYPCSTCHGQGRNNQERSLSVNIPAGIEDGTRIRISGEGNAGLRGGPNGDLYIFLTIAQHEFFQREGSDLYCQVPISMITATLGGQFEVSILDGTKTRVKVPEGTQNGKKFRLKGKGMPVLRQNRRGDIYIQVIVETPQKLTKRQKELLQEFSMISNDENSPQSHGFFARMKEFFEGIHSN